MAVAGTCATEILDKHAISPSSICLAKHAPGDDGKDKRHSQADGKHVHPAADDCLRRGACK
jgi:hypothetical protein